MSFDPRRGRGADGGAQGSVPGEIDYRLARQSLISEFKKGRIDRQEVCDAQTELMRAARNVGEPSARICPICEDAHVVLVTYVFGPRMPASGKCVTTKKELQALNRSNGDLAAYVVEVCPACKWNHLARTFLLTGPSGPLSGKQGPSGPLSGKQGPSGPLSGKQRPATQEPPTTGSARSR